jgi:hypothetical protein
MGDADIADPTFAPEPPQCREMHAPIDQIVDLHQVDDVAAQQACRALHLRKAGLASGNPHFGGEKSAWPRAKRGDEVARDTLGAAIHRRAVHHSCFGSEQPAQDLTQRPARGFVGSDIENRPSAQTDNRELFTG